MMHMNSATELERPQPSSLKDLFWSFTKLALQGFGGVLAVVQLEMVERKRWLTQEEFIEEWAVAQIMPGPNVINLSMMIGGRYFGLRGAMTALAGMLAVAAGLIGATGMKMAGTLKKHPLPMTVTVGSALLGIVFVAVLHWPMIYSLVTIGGLGCVLTYRKLSP